MTKKEYFIEQNGKKQGALTLKELINIDIYEDALIWKAGWEDWKRAIDVEELSAHIIKTPPSTPKEKASIEKKERINKTLQKAPNKAIKIFGIIALMFVLTAVFGAMGNMNGNYGLGIFGYLILGVLGYGIYLIIKIIKE